AGCSRSYSFVDLLEAVGALADPDAHLAALDLLGGHPDPRRPIARRADQHHVRDRDRGGLFDHAAGRHLRAAHPARVAHRARLRVALDRVQVLDDHAALTRARLDYAALLAAVLAGEHLDRVALADSHRAH